MDKRNLLRKLEQKIVADLAILVQSANSAREAAIHSESKAEDQYDTRGLEASYLAGAQSKRVSELEALLTLYRNVELKVFLSETPISVTALIEAEGEGRKFYYFLMPLGGGMTVEMEDKTIQVITPQSPMGEALLGHRAGDQIQVELQKKIRYFDIIEVW